MLRRARGLNTSPLLHLVPNQQMATRSNAEGNHLNACQPPTQGLFMGFSPPLLSRPGAYLTADLRTPTWVRGGCAADSSGASHTGTRSAGQPFPSIPALNQPSLGSQGTKRHWLPYLPALLQFWNNYPAVSYLHYRISVQSCKEAIEGHKDSPKLGKCRQHWKSMRHQCHVTSPCSQQFPQKSHTYLWNTGLPTASPTSKAIF